MKISLGPIESPPYSNAAQMEVLARVASLVLLAPEPDPLQAIILQDELAAVLIPFYEEVTQYFTPYSTIDDRLRDLAGRLAKVIYDLQPSLTTPIVPLSQEKLTHITVATLRDSRVRLEEIDFAIYTTKADWAKSLLGGAIEEPINRGYSPPDREKKKYEIVKDLAISLLPSPSSHEEIEQAEVLLDAWAREYFFPYADDFLLALTPAVEALYLSELANVLERIDGEIVSLDHLTPDLLHNAVVYSISPYYDYVVKT